jgi:predicted O-linked N-acetylglucosamine transferase (SPINDLY family)
VTFGCFNASRKWSDEALQLWAEVLARVDGAKLLLKSADFGKPAIVARVLERFAALGVDAERLVLHGWEPTRSLHFAIYDRVDIAVDTYPYNGATTSCEALWMGVPVVTLAGPTHASRMGASILTAAGHPEWIARTHEQYAQICGALAADLDALATLRAGLRARLAASPLMDGKRFAADLERRYREAWVAWCSGPAA